MRRTVLTLAALAITAVLSAPAADDEGFTPLVNGDDLKQFDLVGFGPETIKIVDGEVHISGKPNGYFATKESYSDYVLRFEWMYERPADLKSDAEFNGNSGLLVHIQGEHKVWPKCVEVQLQNKNAGHTFAINGAKFQGKTDAAAQKKAIKPVGEWNAEEVTSKDGEITVKINGTEVCRGSGAMPDSGTIGWQSEGRPIRFRNLMIKPTK